MKGSDLTFVEAAASAGFQSAGPLHSHKLTTVWVPWPFCPMALGMLPPKSVNDFTHGPSSVLFLDQAHEQQKPLDHTYLTGLLVQGNSPSCCFFLYLRPHYYSH